MNPEPPNRALHIAPFQPDLPSAFSALNLTWIEQYFRVEERDRVALTDCESAIVAALDLA